VSLKFVVTGCAGFIGSNFCDRLLQDSHSVIGIDNFSTGKSEFIESALNQERFTLIEGDLLIPETFTEVFEGADFVIHLAANADVRFGINRRNVDLEQNTIATFNVLEAMNNFGVKKIAFASTGSVYGEAAVFPTPEDAPFPVQTSLYAASKLACEGMITSYCEGLDFQSWIFRFVSILGDRYTHGHVFDFYNQLVKDHKSLFVLGDGKQRKSYLHVKDCIDAVILAMEEANEKVNIFNLGTDEYCNVDQSIAWICEQLNYKPSVSYGGGQRGWVGDNPFIFLDTGRIKSLGWRPNYSIEEGVKSTVDFLKKNKWVFDSEVVE